ncbi:ABC transporter substrate-binding protein [Kitasatospora sp. NPDC004240]
MQNPSLPRRTVLRTALAAAGAVLVPSSVSGCAGTDPTPSGQPTTLAFWGWAKGTREVVEAFNGSRSDIRVVFEEIPAGNAGGYARIAEAAASGGAPDVFNVEYSQLPDFVGRGAVQDITGLVPTPVREGYLPQAVHLCTAGGRLWALPLDAAPQAFYYRKDLFAQAGVEVPRTWEEFRAAAQRLRSAVPRTRIATFFPDDPATFAAMAWQADAHWFTGAGDLWSVDLTRGRTRQTADFWQRLVTDDLVRVQASFSDEWKASLLAGETCGYLGASWGAGVLRGTLPGADGKWAVAPLPSWDGGPASGMLGGTTFAVSKDSRKAKAAVEFATWATTTAEGIKARIASGTSSSYPAAPALVPVARQAFRTDFYGGQDVYAVLERAAGAVRPTWQWGPAVGTTFGSLREGFGRLGRGGGTLPAALEAAQRVTVEEMRRRGLTVGA